MALTPVVLSTIVLAMGPAWSVVDLPYPEVTGAETAPPPIDIQITEAVTHYAKVKAGKSLSQKPEISNLKVEKGTASLRLTLGAQVENVVLMRVNNQWRVVQSLPEKEY